jgi:hypothetical protein
MKNREKSFAMIVPTILFLFLYLALSLTFDLLTHRNHIPIKEKIISWQKEFNEEELVDSMHYFVPSQSVEFIEPLDSAEMVIKD